MLLQVCRCSDDVVMLTWSCCEAQACGVKSAWSTLPLDCGAVESCSVEGWICLAVWWVSLGLATTSRMLPAWLHCANCMGPLGSSEEKTFWTMRCFQLCGNNLRKALFFSSMTAPQCTLHSKVQKDMVRWAWCGKTWLALTESWPQLYQTSGMNWNWDYEPGIRVQHHSLTSKML